MTHSFTEDRYKQKVEEIENVKKAITRYQSEISKSSIQWEGLSEDIASFRDEIDLINKRLQAYPDSFFTEKMQKRVDALGVSFRRIVDSKRKLEEDRDAHADNKKKYDFLKAYLESLETDFLKDTIKAYPDRLLPKKINLDNICEIPPAQNIKEDDMRYQR